MTKNPFVIICCSLSLALVGFNNNIFAQDKDKSQGKPGTPVESAEVNKAIAKTIFDYKDRLGLTDKQVADLKDIIFTFQEYLLDRKKELNILNAELNSLMQEKADLKLIRNKLEQITKSSVDTGCMDIETARKTEGILTAAQLEEWHKLQEESRKELKE